MDVFRFNHSLPQSLHLTQELDFFHFLLHGCLLCMMRKPGLKAIKLFSCSTRLNLKFITLVNVKMPTIVGILTFISMINTKFMFKARNIFIFWYFSFCEQVKFRAQLS